MKTLITSCCLFSFFVSTAFAASDCSVKPGLKQEKSQELIRLYDEDQADRSVSVGSIDWKKASKRDLRRRISVAKIFAEGCFSSSDDYRRAALIYQHGDTADQYFQAFIWSSKSVKLGGSDTLLVADAIDRYLVTIGNKQLFGTQLSQNAGSQLYCLQPIEESFPDSERSAYMKMPLSDYIALVFKTDGIDQDPQGVQPCSTHLAPTPSGSVPGVW